MRSAPERVEELTARVLGDLGAILSAPLILLGARLGFYRELAAARRGLTAAELAQRTGAAEPAVRLWLENQVCGGFIEHDADGDRFSMNAQQVLALDSESTRESLRTILEHVCGFFGDLDAIAARVRSGDVAPPREPPGCGEAIANGLERLLHPHCVQCLTASWIPAISGLDTRLRRGIPVAELACGTGDASIAMAAAFPRSRFYGFDQRPEMIELARSAAADAGVEANCQFSVGSLADLPPPAAPAEEDRAGYEVVLVLHGASLRADLAAAAAPIHRRLTHTGVWVVVEPYRGGHAEGRFNPLRRASIAAAALTGAPVPELAASDGIPPPAETSWRAAAVAAGFARVRPVVETPFHVVNEARV